MPRDRVTIVNFGGSFAITAIGAISNQPAIMAAGFVGVMLTMVESDLRDIKLELRGENPE